ncbi:double-strand break repair helicase AddA [Rhodobacter calidifons]|uniref:DNA 3'-5' helicase n=1 Tax=Rhodobacter calidifons TaxID=2715277 RepID=A0ABX0G6Y4_9RHOB|nr:double-strand break repair helicase AddA [Rhodobacter calidifons]NHB76623.1 double-strand break repair helicase AddA [Rhodobacter calidifons]
MTEAFARQIAAANPRRNTWLSANAGSGKTRVLTDRVARLLLNGVDPQRILCLTYTKAAATEMQNRLFERLGEWAMRPEAALLKNLSDLGEGDLTPERLARARQLFARAIETPGGLRIQTIHSFCASLLRRFPLEAGVSPGFVEMEDRAGRLMRAEIVEEMADGPQAHVVRRLSEIQADEDFGSLVEAIVSRRAHFDPPLDRPGVLRLFGLPEGVDDRHLLSLAFNGSEDWLIARTLPLFRQGSQTMQDLAAVLAAHDWQAPTKAALEALYGALLKKDGQPNFAKVPTVKVRTAMGDMQHDFDDFMQRVANARDAEKAVAAAERTLALHDFAGVFLKEYAARKAARGLLDFDDLIRRALQLLKDPSLAAWVLYRLDGGLDHILVDEAQDTSPDQWQLIEELAAELISGEGSATRDRTLFVVGDKKQSIYSFQGADVAAFDRMRKHFGARLAGGAGLDDRVLEHSFRSSPAILNVVDATFTPAEQVALGGASHHIAISPNLAGRVDVWPVLEKAETPVPGPWDEPLDMRHPEDAQIVLAQRIARWIKEQLDQGTQIPQAARLGGPSERPVRPGDFLILVQRRTGVFHDIIRACKAAGLPIAGADRLRLGGVLAVRDLSALLAFLDTPEDDLSLACVLRSPLCGWSEAELFRLAQPRQGYLWQALRAHPDHAETRAFLDDMRAQADFLRPYDLIERVLNRHDGRRKLVSRLGPEAEDGIDELLSQALAYETAEVPSLTGFLTWMETDDVEVKRQAEGAGDLIRVMTVHGAKGLEAEIVILPECADYSPPQRGQIEVHPTGPALWKMKEGESPALLTSLRQDRAEREAAERLRLLYVAMTRARCWLVAAGAGKVTQDTTWHRLIAAGVSALDHEELEGGILRHSHGAWPAPLRRDPPQVALPALPDWTTRPAAEPLRPAPVLSPSDLGGPKALPAESARDAEGAKRRGTALHLLLERLPGLDPATWPAHAEALIAEPAQCQAVLDEARAVLTHPDLVALFGPDSLAEVAVAAPWRGRILAGSVDRLILSADRALIVDYKSNAVIPDRAEAVPEGILRQLGAYAHMVGQIYSDRRIETAILWTRAPSLMRVDPEIVRQALDRTTIP